MMSCGTHNSTQIYYCSWLLGELSDITIQINSHYPANIFFEVVIVLGYYQHKIHSTSCHYIEHFLHCWKSRILPIPDISLCGWELMTAWVSSKLAGLKVMQTRYSRTFSLLYSFRISHQTRLRKNKYLLKSYARGAITVDEDIRIGDQDGFLNLLHRSSTALTFCHPPAR